MTKEHGRYLLLVEDSRDQREAMQAALEIEGYHVIAVPGGAGSAGPFAGCRLALPDPHRPHDAWQERLAIQG